MLSNKEYADKMRDRFPAGTRVEMDYMDDPDAILPGTKGTVDHIDDVGQIHVNWDNGRYIAIIPEEDSFHKIIEKGRDNGAR